MDKETFGIWILFLTITTLLDLVKDGFLRNGIIKYLADSNKEEHESIVMGGLVINTIISLIIILFIILFSSVFARIWDATEIIPMFSLYIISVIFLIPNSHFIYIQQGNFEFKGTFYSSLARKGIFFLGIIYFFYFKTELKSILNTLVLLDAGAIFISSIIGYYHTLKFIFYSRKINLIWIKKLFHYGKYVFGTSIGSNILNMTDQWMLGSLLSPGSVSIYSTAVRINNFVDIPTTSISAIIFPVSAQRNKEEGNSSTKYLYEKSVAAIFSITLPVILIIFLFADFTIYFIAGKGYEEAIAVLKLTILYNLFRPFGRQFGTMMDSIGLPHLTFKALVIVSVINIVLNYFLISNLGIFGAVYATLGSKIIGFLINQWILYKYINVSIKGIFIHLIGFYKEGFIFISKRIGLKTYLSNKSKN